MAEPQETRETAVTIVLKGHGIRLVTVACLATETNLQTIWRAKQPIEPWPKFNKAPEKW